MSTRLITAKCASRVFAAGFAVALAAAAAAGGIDSANSQVTANFRQMNVPVEGRFNAFSGSIDFDANKPAAARARIEVDTASFDVGAPEYNDELRKPEWFDTAAHPKAVFVSSAVTAAGPNRFEVVGKLTLKGKTHEFKIPVTRRSDAGRQIYEGELPISRKAFAIGGADWADTVDDKVVVKFRIATAK